MYVFLLPKNHLCEKIIIFYLNDFNAYSVSSSLNLTKLTKGGIKYKKPGGMMENLYFLRRKCCL